MVIFELYWLKSQKLYWSGWAVQVEFGGMIQDWTNIVVSNLPAAQRKLGITAGGVPLTRRILTAAPLTGGGDLSVDRTHSIPKATALVDGYLAAADFAAFLAS